MSKLYFRYGAMNSGKSTHLMQVAYNYEERGMVPIIIKPDVDKKGGRKVVSRLGVDKEVDFLINKQDNILEIIEENLNHGKKIDCIIVDEVQFLLTHHIDELFEIAVTKDIPVICYGLRTDFKMNGFEGSERLLLLAHSIEEMKTICKCGRKAVLNARMLNGEFIFEGEQVAIDLLDNVQYEALCGQCYFKYKSQSKN
ncbi:MAG: thymidine kinase [Clostridium perfringens]|nr:thymidine kinase [Clostridium perfringens]